MAKKKSYKARKQKDPTETSEDEANESSFQGKVCSHVPRGVNFSRVKKIMKTINLTVCSGCTEVIPEDEDVPEVWFCLQCGNCGCGRMSTNQHGLQHFKTIHSDCHSLVLSTSSGVVWCYECDDEVPLQSSQNLKQCVEFIMKSKGNNSKTNATIEEKAVSIEKSLLDVKLEKEETNTNASGSDSVSKKPDSKRDSMNKKELASSKVHVKGLRNLGNTCYFNAVMQSLSQTTLLNHILEETCSKEYRWEVPQLKVKGESIVEDIHAEPVKITLPREFQLVNTFLQFLKRMSAYSQNKNEVVNPSDLFGDLQKKSPQFQYFHQQDSHELLRQFLDGLKQDEMKRQKKAILRHFNIINLSPEDIENETKKLIKAYSSYASHTIIEKIFGGLLISTVLCEECKMSSQVFEPFMDLSLPLFEEKKQDSSDHPSALLDGGKQGSVKGIRIRKPEQECDDDNEYILNNKSKKDYGKPSKYQEKRMKQQEKKEKKKNKKMQNKKFLKNEDNSQDAIEDELNSENVEKEIEAENNDIERLNVIDSTEQNGKSSKSDDPSRSDEIMDIEDILDVNATNHGEQNREIETNSAIKEPDLFKGNNLGVMNGHSNTHNPDNEMGDSVALANETESIENNDEDTVILFDEVVYWRENREITASALVNGKAELSDEEVLSETEKSGLEVNVSAHQPILDSPDSVQKQISTAIDSTELEERIYALSMQVSEVRIRRDSGKQDSILSSSPPSEDDSESSKPNATSNDSKDEKDDSWSRNLSESQTKEWILKSLTTLKSRRQMPSLECSLDTCLSHFTKAELLMGSNKFRCENCSEMKRRKTGDKKAAVYSNASKQLLIFSPPAILTLHLKRFQQVGMSLRKVNRLVEFPLILDIAPYTSSACLILPHMNSVQDEILYSLYGIVEHSGHLKSGHYTAYVKAKKRTLNRSFISQLPLAQWDLEQLLHKFSSLNSSDNDSEGFDSSKEEVRWYYVSDNHVREASEAQVLRCQAYLLFYERIK